MTTDTQLKLHLSQHFRDLFDLKLVRPDLYQVLLPYYHPDGDMYEVFINPQSGGLVIQDLGLTLMRLSYDVETEKGQKPELIARILSEYRIQNDGGNLFVRAATEQELLPCLLLFLDALSRISALSLLTVKHYRSQFYEQLKSLLQEQFPDRFIERYEPKEVPSVQDYFSPHALRSDRHPEGVICIFPIGSDDRCDEVTITVQHYQLSQYHPPLIGIYENMENLKAKKISRVTNLLDKQFSFFSQNEGFIKDYLQRQVA